MQRLNVHGLYRTPLRSEVKYAQSWQFLHLHWKKNWISNLPAMAVTQHTQKASHSLDHCMGNRNINQLHLILNFVCMHGHNVPKIMRKKKKQCSIVRAELYCNNYLYSKSWSITWSLGTDHHTPQWICSWCWTLRCMSSIPHQSRLRPGKFYMISAGW